ncbi:MAG: carboxypeptidase regulatory-like domain-containing protein, partial [Bacteroidaceae bacterium]|nr:carboxypeptidase regulatory-like domain-containing protein [Bacteroidaceae bacterium]
MRHKLILSLLLCCIASALAQEQNVSGTIKGPDGTIAKVSVREIDNNHRVLNHTTSDRNGLFTFHVRDAARHSLQFYAPGYRTFTHKML